MSRFFNVIVHLFGWTVILPTTCWHTQLLLYLLLETSPQPLITAASYFTLRGHQWTWTTVLYYKEDKLLGNVVRASHFWGHNTFSIALVVVLKHCLLQVPCPTVMGSGDSAVHVQLVCRACNIGHHSFHSVYEFLMLVWTQVFYRILWMCVNMQECALLQPGNKQRLFWYRMLKHISGCKGF